MRTRGIKFLSIFLAVFVVFGVISTTGYCKDSKIGYVDLRRAFYEYSKTKQMEADLDALTKTRQDERTKKIEVITKLRDEAELLSGTAKENKQKDIDSYLKELQDYDKDTRQMLLTKKNDMFRAVIEDIQKVVESLGKGNGYDYVLDSRNIMYAKPDFDLTDKVIAELNK